MHLLQAITPVSGEKRDLDKLRYDRHVQKMTDKCPKRFIRELGVCGAIPMLFLTMS
jgi:hypothetical protein